MNESVDESQTPERRVFGKAFSFYHGPADTYTQSIVQNERLKSLIIEKQQGWLPNVLHPDKDFVVAHLYSNGVAIATLSCNRNTLLTDVHVKAKNGQSPDFLLCSEELFDEAVEQAEQLLIPID